MPTTKTLSVDIQTFPVGTSVSAYKQANWPSGNRNTVPVGAPKGSSDATASVASDGSLAFTGLTDSTQYTAVAQVSSVYRYVDFDTYATTHQMTQGDAAGGLLGGSYPNPTLAASAAAPSSALALGNSSNSSDTLSSRLFLKPSSATENAIMVKRPNAAWGNGTAYGTGQTFALLKHSVSASDIGYTGVTPDDFVLARMDGYGSVGLAGNFHLATGLRADAGYAPTYAFRLNPYVDTKFLEMYANTGVTQTNPFIIGYTPGGTTEAFRLKPDGTGVFGEGTSTGAGKGMAIGNIGNGAISYFGVAHSDRMNTTDYALEQGPNGDTYLNAASGQSVTIQTGGSNRAIVDATQTLVSALKITGNVGFFNTALQAKKTVTGSRGGNAALASLLTQLAGYGLLTDSTSA